MQKVTFRLTTFSSGTIVLDPDGTEDGVNVDVDAASAAAADTAVGVEVAAAPPPPPPPHLIMKLYTRIFLRFLSFEHTKI